MTPPLPLADVVPEVMESLLRRAASRSYARWAEQVRGASYCTNPIRLTGKVVAYDRRQGFERVRYGTGGEPDGVLLHACGNRRASVCRPCSETYRYDTYHLVSAGLRGGKGVPPDVTSHPAVFVTLTAPSFGLVHANRGDGKPCRPRHHRPQQCPHGVELHCERTHDGPDERLGRPLCSECYDYMGAVLFNATAPDLWRRTTIYLRLELARLTQCSVGELRRRVRVSYAKVAEYQRRGLVHFHAVIRLDGADPVRPTPPPSNFTPELLQEAVRSAVARAYVRLAPLRTGEPPRVLRWGEQLDVQHIATDERAGHLTAAAVAAYVAKYATKATESAGAPPRRLTGREDLDVLGINPHVATMIRTCWQLAAYPDLAALRLERWAHMLGFRGHFSTKSRRYSTTLGALRQARADFRKRHDDPSEDPHAQPTVLVVCHWRYAGLGYTTRGDALLAASAAARARERREVGRLALLIDPTPVA